jgi:hypothetical protein
MCVYVVSEPESVSDFADAAAPILLITPADLHKVRINWAVG